MIAKVKLTIDSWDTDGRKTKLPKKVEVEVEIEREDSIDSIHDIAMDKASDLYGFCINSSIINSIKINRKNYVKHT